MDARKALEVLNEYVNDASSFVELFDEPQDFYGDAIDEDGEPTEGRRPIDDEDFPINEAFRVLERAVTPSLRTLVFDAPEYGETKGQVLVTIYPEGRVDVAWRAWTGFGSWGPPWSLTVSEPSIVPSDKTVDPTWADPLGPVVDES